MLTELAKRCVELSYRHKLTHVSSVLNTVDLIDEIYRKRMDDDPFVLGNGHAALALYIVLESRRLCDAEEMIAKHGVHPSRDMEHGIWCSSGSLGLAETVAAGMALADKSKTAWLVTSDGACLEGSVCEVMRFKNSYRLDNLRVYVVFNGFGAYGDICMTDLPKGVVVRQRVITGWPIWLRGLAGHYLILTESQRDELLA